MSNKKEAKKATATKKVEKNSIDAQMTTVDKFGLKKVDRLHKTVEIGIIADSDNHRVFEVWGSLGGYNIFISTECKDLPCKESKFHGTWPLKHEYRGVSEADVKRIIKDMLEKYPQTAKKEKKAVNKKADKAEKKSNPKTEKPKTENKKLDKKAEVKEKLKNVKKPPVRNKKEVVKSVAAAVKKTPTATKKVTKK